VTFAWTTASTLTLDEQREQYKKAKIALQKGNIKTFSTLSENLKDYPLYPYLRYNYLNKRIHKVKVEELKAFIQTYNDFVLTDSLRTKWLNHLARTAQWQTFLDNYTPQNDTILKCYQLQARIKTSNQVYLLEDIRTLWLAGKSQPPQCDPAFALLYKSELMTTDLVWERIRLAMNNGKTGLVHYLSKRLDESHKKWATRWLAMHSNADKWTHQPDYDDNDIAREILTYGIKRLVRSNINKTIGRWEKLQGQYNFTPREAAEVDRVIAIRAVKKKHAKAIELLDKIENSMVDDEIFHWRLRAALEHQDWSKLRRWTEGQPPFEDIKYRWIYWHARAVEQTGDFAQAQNIYSSIANQREYYGFLAADRVNAPYQMHHKPLPENLEEKEKIAKMPGIKRAKELYLIKENYSARREWQHAIRSMTSYQMQIAAEIATEWGWYDRAIMTMANAHAYDDLDLRFPLTFRHVIDANATKKQLDLGWIYALIRSESAFIEDVRSPAGALGLMQVMPQTGKFTAKNMGWKKFHKNQLLVAEKNVQIGSTYLIRTVTMIDTGVVQSVSEHEIVLTSAAWIADTGRFSDALESAEFSEVEPFPDGEVIIGRGAIIDAVKIKISPRSKK